MLLRLCSECLCSPMCVSDATGDCYVGSESNQQGRSDNAAGWVNARRWSGDAADLMATLWCRAKNWIAQQEVWQRTVVFQLTDIFFIGQEIGVSLIRSKVLHQQLSRIKSWVVSGPEERQTTWEMVKFAAVVETKAFSFLLCRDRF